MKKLIFIALFALLFIPILCTACNPGSNTEYVAFRLENKIIFEGFFEKGTKLQQPTVDEREGYVFKGWYKSKDFIEKWDFENDVVTYHHDLYAYYVAENEETFNILYYDEQTLLHYEKVQKGSLPTPYEPTKVRRGFEFDYWLHGNDRYHFNSEVTTDIILKMKWNLITYKVTFVADNKTIAVVEYDALNMDISGPSVPQKEHYTGKWQKFMLDFADIEVKAIYTPIVYTAEFQVDDKTVSRINYTVEDEVTPPQVPARKGYNGEWIGLPIIGGDVILTAKYTPITYTITYKENNNIIEVCEYTIENLVNHIPPKVPEKLGHSAAWEKKNFEYGNVTIYAVYTPLTYTATFKSDGKIIGSCQFKYDDMNIFERCPQVPPKVGYTAAWENILPKYEDFTVNAIYTPITYYADFYIGEEKFKTTTFTVESTSITVPKSESREHYDFSWGTIPPISANNVKIIGKYTPTTYKVKFIADGVIVSEQTYTVENTKIEIPPLPHKDKHNGEWEQIHLVGGDITINAKYTQFDQTELNFKDEFTYETNSDGTLTVTGYIGTETFLYVPSKHDDKVVKIIKKRAFMNNSEIVGIKFNHGLEIIEDESFFYAKNLVNVILPDSLTTIGKCVFGYCAFTSIGLPDSITFIDEQAFARTSLNEITLPNNLVKLNNIFYYCEQLTKVIWGEKISEMSDLVFEGCKNLTEITIPKTAKAIRHGIFLKSGIKRITLENPLNWRVLSMDDKLVKLGDYSPLADPATVYNWLFEIHASRKLAYFETPPQE